MFFEENNLQFRYLKYFFPGIRAGILLEISLDASPEGSSDSYL